MAIGDDNMATPKPRPAVGDDLSRLSVHELEARIDALGEELARTRQALETRRSVSSAAHALFRSPGTGA